MPMLHGQGFVSGGYIDIFMGSDGLSGDLISILRHAQAYFSSTESGIIYCARTIQRVHAKKKIRTKDRFVKENEKAVYISHTMKLHVHLSKF